MLKPLGENSLGHKHYRWSRPLWPNGLSDKAAKIINHGDSIIDDKERIFYATRCQTCKVLILKELLEDSTIVMCCDSPRFPELWYKGN